MKAAIYLCRAVVALLLALVRDWPAQFEDEAEVRTSTTEPTPEVIEPSTEPTTDGPRSVAHPEARP